jgi:NifU-like protein involved in Fe-S cluster formation
VAQDILSLFSNTAYTSDQSSLDLEITVSAGSTKIEVTFKNFNCSLIIFSTHLLIEITKTIVNTQIITHNIDNELLSLLFSKLFNASITVSKNIIEKLLF